MSEMVHPQLINKIYLGGPLENCSREEATGWREDCENQLREKGNILSLIPGFDSTKNDSATICWLDYKMIDESEACLFNLTYLADDGVGTGTLCEVGYSNHIGPKGNRLVVGFTEKPWTKKHMFLRGNLIQLFETRQEAIDYIVGFNHRKELKKII